jgi:hypothetical protein
MKLKLNLAEQKLSGELERVRKLFLSAYKQFLKSKSRDTKLDFIESIIDDTLTKSDIKFLILRLQKGYQKKKS